MDAVHAVDEARAGGSDELANRVSVSPEILLLMGSAERCRSRSRVSSDRQNLLDLCIALLVHDFNKNDRVVGIHDADRIDLKLADALDDDRITMKPQQAVGLANEPLRHSVTGFEHPSLLGHFTPLIG